MLHVLVLVLLAITACKERGTQASAQGSAAGSAAVASPPAPPPPPPELPDSYADLVGARRATMGKTLAPLKLGEAVEPDLLPHVPATTFGFLGETEPRIFRRATEDAGPKVVVNLEIRGGKLFAIRADLLTETGSIPDDKCAGVAAALAAKWGPAPEHVWADRDAHMRVALVDTCRLVFERYVDVAQWIGPEPAAIVPVGAVSKPAKLLAPRVGSGMKLTEDVTYRDAGVGERGTGATIIDVYVKKGIVSGIGAETEVPAADRAAIRERISAAFGVQPTRDPVTGYDVWATKVPLRMLETQRGVRIEAGNLTP